MVALAFWTWIYWLIISASAGTSSLPLNATNITNSNPQSFNDSIELTSAGVVFLPYYFAVPDTNIVLRLGFGIRRRALDPMDLRSMLVVAADQVQEQITIHGAQGWYPHLANDQQKYVFELGGDGIRLSIVSLDYPFGLFDWGDLRDVLLGLKLYLVDGNRPRQTYFKFYENFGGLGHPVGAGRIESILGFDGVEES